MQRLRRAALAAATDDELLRQVQAHHEAEHGDGPASLDEQQAREMIAREAYDAGDA